MDEAVLDELLAKVRQRADTHAYFFDRLDSAAWIRVLRERGFFLEPIGVEHLEGGYVRFPPWPESRALARLAPEDEETVLEVILACPDTDNPRIHDDFVDAALAMSPEKGAAIVPLVGQWLGKPYKLLMPLRAGQLMARFAEAGLVEEALTLARLLLKLDRADVAGVGDDAIASPPRFVAHFDDWDYKKILEDEIPRLVRAIGLPALESLCAVLQEVLEEEGGRFGGRPRDASYIWRPSIAEHEQNIEREPKDFLVTAIREGANIVIVSEQGSVAEVVELLERQQWDVFDRIAIHIATAHLDRDAAVAVRLLLRRDLLASIEVSNEYSILTRAALPATNHDERAKWVSWIAAGPDSQDYVELRRSRGEPDPSPEELADRADAWRWHRIAFAPLEELTDEGQRLYEDLAARFDEPSPLPFAVYSSFGTATPISTEDATAMSMAELAQFASEVAAGPHYDSPEEGFASELREQAASRPGDASYGLQHFQQVKPVFMRSLMSGLEQAARASSVDINWESVLEVSRWVLQQPREVEGGSGGSYSDLDPGWVWTISAITDLVREGLQRRLLPIDLRNEVWHVITTLLVEQEDEPSDHDDPGTASLNHIRGKAMHAVVLYADWLFEAQRTDELPPRSFGANSPEVVSVLDKALDPEVQPAPSVRAVFGMHTAILTKLDPDWMESRARRIFSTGEDGSFDRLGLAAWGSYLKYSRGFIDVMMLLRPQYEISVASLSGEADSEGTELQQHLAEHIMLMYWHGKLGSTPHEDSMFTDFWHGAVPKVRRRALEFVGHNLRDVGDSFPEDVQERLKLLWDTTVGWSEERSDSDVSDLKAFGWWVIAEILEPPWVLPRLVEVLEEARGIDPEGQVISVLATTDESMLALAAKALRLIVANDRDGWGIHGHQDEAYVLVQRALQSGEPEAAEEARAAANLLMARGFTEFRQLLDDASSHPVDQ